MSIKKLTAENAIIKTASVEVKTLTISGKQVTLAVFRQLPEKPLIDLENLQLNGIPWGTVNYHPDKCGDDSGHHLHVVWQTGLTLCRSKVPDSIWKSPALVRLEAVRLLYSAMTYLDEDGDGWHTGYSEASKHITVKDGDSSWPLILSVGYKYTGSHSQNVLRKAAEAICAENQSSSRQQCLNQLSAALQGRDRWQARYLELYAQLKELDQLYIAV